MTNDLEGGQQGSALGRAEQGQHLGSPGQQRLKRHPLPPGLPLCARVLAVAHHRQKPRHKQPRLGTCTHTLTMCITVQLEHSPTPARATCAPASPKRVIMMICPTVPLARGFFKAPVVRVALFHVP